LQKNYICKNYFIMETAKSQIVDVENLLQGNVLAGQTSANPDQQTEQISDNQDVEQENIDVQKQEVTEAKAEPNQEEIVLNYFKSKGKNINSIDDLLAEPKEKEINPYQEILDDEDKAYLEFKRENPKKSRRDFEAIYSDVNQISPLEFARARVLQEAGVSLTNEQIDQYLEEELSAVDLVKLSKYGKPIKDQRIAEQQRYKENKDTSIKEEQNNNDTEYVRLDNNTVMLRSDYDKLVNERNDYLKNLKEAGDSITTSVFSVIIDDNGDKQERTYTYEYDQKDKHSMLSLATDVQQMVRERYYSDKGFKHKEFNEDLFWIKPENRNKAISLIVQKARAEAIEEVLKNRGNFNFQPTQTIDKAQKDGIKTIPIKELFN